MADETDSGVAEYSAKWWMKEINAFEKYAKEKWHDSAQEAADRYLDLRSVSSGMASGVDDTTRRKYNIFWANVQISKSALYATPPKPEIKRQHDDAKDDIARTAALILERIVNFGLDKDQSDMHAAFDMAVDGLLIPGMGQVWLRYDVETAPIVIEGVKGEKIVSESVATDHVNWRDFLYSISRTWGEVWWVGRRIWMKKKRFIKIFGEAKYKEAKESFDSKTTDQDGQLPKGFTKGRIEVFEVWCEDTNKVYWIQRHLDDLLKESADPLGLDNFFPCPKPLLATHTPDALYPRPDYRMVQDQYEELDTLNERISMLTKALRVVGMYDKESTELSKMLSGGEFNMIAVDNWAAFAEKGGMKGIVEWFPVEVIAEVLERLTNQRIAVVTQIYELTSISDIMRGASNPRDTLGAQKMKAQYSSVRLQLRQQDVGKFVRGAIALKCEIICRKWSPETIKKISQIEFTESAQHADKAIALLKNFETSQYRIEVGEETLSLADYNAERELRVEYLTAVGQFLSQAGQMLVEYPQALPYILKMIAWVTAAFRGSSDIETVLDEAMQDAINNPAQPKGEEGDNGAEAQAKIAIAQMDAQVEAQKLQVSSQVDAAKMAMEERVAMAEIQSRERISLENNRTQVLLKQMELGQADKELGVKVTQMELDLAEGEADRQHETQEAEQDRAQSAVEAEASREHASAEGEEQRSHDEQMAKEKSREQASNRTD
jgi:hypothetical protein